MDKLFKSYLEESKKDVTKLRDLKQLFVKHQQFELASKVREVERELFPVSEEDEKLMNEAVTFKTALAMVDINASENHTFILLQMAKIFINKNMEFDLRDASKIKALAEKLYK